MRRRVDYFVKRGAVDAKNVNRIIELGESLQKEKAKTYGNKTARHAQISWIWAADAPWLFGKIWSLIHEANRQFKFDLEEIEPLQYTVYPDGGLYDWHMDKGRYTRSEISRRKLGLTIQLTKPEEYGRGDLELKLGDDDLLMPGQRGTAIIFPSYVLHRVTPVSYGERRSLVAWVSGPEFR